MTLKVGSAHFATESNASVRAQVCTGEPNTHHIGHLPWLRDNAWKHFIRTRPRVVSLKPWTIVAALAVALQMVACSINEVVAGEAHTIFPSVEAAVVAASNRFNPISIAEDREFLGTVYRVGESYAYTVSSGRIGSGAAELHLRRASVEDVVALWHTHGARRELSDSFSHADTAAVNQLGVPMYLADHKGFLKVFRPGDRRRSTVSGSVGQLPSGHEMGLGERVRDHTGKSVRVRTHRL